MIALHAAVLELPDASDFPASAADELTRIQIYMQYLGVVGDLEAALAHSSSGDTIDVCASLTPCIDSSNSFHSENPTERVDLLLSVTKLAVSLQNATLSSRVTGGLGRLEVASRGGITRVILQLKPLKREISKDSGAQLLQALNGSN